MSLTKRTKLKAALGAAAAIVAAGALIASAPKKHDHDHDHDHTHADHRHVAELDKPAPGFTLVGTDKKEVSLKDYKGKVVVLEWFNPDCPFVKHHYDKDVQTTTKLQEEFAKQDVVWLRINSGAEGKQGAGRERNLKAIEQYGIKTPVLLDESGKVGKMYAAKRTPELYVIDAEGVLRYHGAIDDNPRPSGTAKTNYVRDAVKAVLAGEEVDVKQTKAYGCGVKYGR